MKCDSWKDRPSGSCYREILELLEKTEEKNVLLHFGRVTFMSSAASGKLIQLNRKCSEYKVSLKLCSITPDIRQVFKITGLEKVFDIHADPAKAMEAFKKSGRLSFRERKPSSAE